MLFSWIYAIVASVMMVITIVMIYVIDKMKRGIDPMPAFIAAMLTPLAMSKAGKAVVDVVSSVNDALSQPLGYSGATKKDEDASQLLTLPGMFVQGNDNLTLPGFYPSSQPEQQS